LLANTARWLSRAWPPLVGMVLLALGVVLNPGAGALFLFSLACTWWLVPHVAVLARRVGAMARPGGRAVNRKATPLLGGAAVALPVFAALIAVASDGLHRAWGLAAGTLVMLVLGTVDDIMGVRPRTKVLAQILAGLCLVVSGFTLPALGCPGLGTFTLGSASIPLILFWVVLVTNAFNLIDGMDGLASTIGFMAAVACVMVGALPPVGLVVAGACVGFLRHNLPPARIFLGDCGSLVLGFVLAALALEIPTPVNVPVTLAVLGYPLGDVTLAVLRRFVRGKPLFAPDRSHVHHKALQHLGTAPKALLAIATFAAVPMVLAVVHPGRSTIAVLLLMWCALAVALVLAGRLRPALVVGYRHPLQRMYAVRQYVATCIGLAGTKAEVELVMRHMAEALRLTQVVVGQLVVPGVTPERGTVPVTHHVPLKRGTAMWAAEPLWQHGILEEERQTITTDLVRQAASRLQSLGSEGPAGDTLALP
jgi:UDP-GlcNAc:undecaprenyl-phosphate GlcNAc-1-phosphate transferase